MVYTLSRKNRLQDTQNLVLSLNDYPQYVPDPDGFISEFSLHFIYKPICDVSNLASGDNLKFQTKADIPGEGILNHQI